METNAGVSNKEIAVQVRQITKMLNDLLQEANVKGLDVKISINPHFKNIQTITINSITQSL